MTDIYKPYKRSKIMSNIRNRETEPEMFVTKYLFKNGFRFRKNDGRYPGKPDIVLPKYNTIIFINGCFWHSHKCKAGKLPETNVQFWKEKIKKNKERDKKNIKKCIEQGWNVIVIWQCELKNKSIREKRLTKLVKEIKDNI